MRTDSPMYIDSRAPRGARGLKLGMALSIFAMMVSRAPRGARGLKFRVISLMLIKFGSCPSRGTWIEILMSRRPGIGGESCPSRGTWIEISYARC